MLSSFAKLFLVSSLVDEIIYLSTSYFVHVDHLERQYQDIWIYFSSKTLMCMCPIEQQSIPTSQPSKFHSPKGVRGHFAVLNAVFDWPPSSLLIIGDLVTYKGNIQCTWTVSLSFHEASVLLVVSHGDLTIYKWMISAMEHLHHQLLKCCNWSYKPSFAVNDICCLIDILVLYNWPCHQKRQLANSTGVISSCLFLSASSYNPYYALHAIPLVPVTLFAW